MMLHSTQHMRHAAICMQQDDAAPLVPAAVTAAEMPPATQEDEHAQSKV
jgi:hypothetical protein